MFMLGFEKTALSLSDLRGVSNRIFARHGVRRERSDTPTKYQFKKTKVTEGPAYIHHTGKIHKSSDMSHLVSKAGHLKGVNLAPKDKEIVNRLVTLHEQAEKKFSQEINKGKHKQYGFYPKTHSGFVSHAHPGVIIEESNALSSMGNESAGAKKVYEVIRGGKYDNTKSILENRFPGYSYGQTRVSRHAKKRMTESLHRAATEANTMSRKEAYKKLPLLHKIILRMLGGKKKGVA